ncbi:heavy metal-responsive transcriptional regulator [Fischerella thermalis CCMEE 5198]|jgi:DNA-binding transcriptional MerR regulator|uniref:heavy metal-responsive transcriptional regulator n=1 Tax=Fischerella thermalis TaxID=372787 RepID=UPI000C80A997|nr:heavy metal-responsive transcriptional regulator [Fischerella thermalis]PLZ89668.1 heavy metal-responsive transcriptional regulator [Fischerella thermalis CCMEE 5196]PMB24359.1 heavy metal-responsive transcriptional regulator [Fischerella thermalis CCMEE 5198]
MLQVGEVSHKLGLNPQTLYFYERIGLIPKPRRTESGYRLYEETDIERLAFITRAKALGLTLDEIKEVLLLQNGEAPPCHEIHSKLVSKVSQIEEAIAQLQEGIKNYDSLDSLSLWQTQGYAQAQFRSQSMCVL